MHPVRIPFTIRVIGYSAPIFHLQGKAVNAASLGPQDCLSHCIPGQALDTPLDFGHTQIRLEEQVEPAV